MIGMEPIATTRLVMRLSDVFGNGYPSYGLKKSSTHVVSAM